MFVLEFVINNGSLVGFFSDISTVFETLSSAWNSVCPSGFLSPLVLGSGSRWFEVPWNSPADVYQAETNTIPNQNNKRHALN